MDIYVFIKKIELFVILNFTIFHMYIAYRMYKKQDFIVMETSASLII